MADDAIPEDLRRFLFDTVESYEQLESLLLVARAPDVSWTTDRVAESLKIPPGLAQPALAHLQARGVLDAITAVDGVTYSVRSTHAELVGRLDRLYDEQRVLVMRTMNSNTIARVRNDAIRTFADAFLLRKKPPDG